MRWRGKGNPGRREYMRLDCHLYTFAKLAPSLQELREHLVDKLPAGSNLVVRLYIFIMDVPSLLSLTGNL